MEKYEYPKEVTDENFKALCERAKVIRQKIFDLDTLSVFVFVLIFVIVLTIPILALITQIQALVIQDKTLFSTSVLIIAGISSLLSIPFFNIVRASVRRVHFAIYKYPTSEECVFAECFIIANRLNKNRICGDWRTRYQTATWRIKLLCEELSLFSKDLFNTKRRFYSTEFALLSNGETEMARMFLFSGSKASNMLTTFALSFVRNDDVLAYRHLKAFIFETNKYGQFESVSKLIGNQLRSVRGIIALVGGVVALIGGILTIILQLT